MGDRHAVFKIKIMDNNIRIQLINDVAKLRLESAMLHKKIALIHLDITTKEELINEELNIALRKSQAENLDAETRELYYLLGNFITKYLLYDKRIPKIETHEKFLEAHPRYKKDMDSTKFKRHIKEYCEFAGLRFNPAFEMNCNDKKRIVSNGKEYLFIRSPESK